MLTRLLAYLLTYLHTRPLTYLRLLAFSLTYLLAYLLTYAPACSLAYLPPWTLPRSRTYLILKVDPADAALADGPRALSKSSSSPIRDAFQQNPSQNPSQTNGTATVPMELHVL